MALVLRGASGDPSVVATYVVPMSPARAVAASVITVVFVLALVAAMVADVLAPGGVTTSWVSALGALAGVVLVVVLSRSALTLRRGYYLVRRPALLWAPAGGYLLRPRRGRR